MLCMPSEPFDSPAFLFEPKFDGTRCIAFITKGRTRLQNRRLFDITGRYPELSLHAWVKAREAILDGEIVVFRQGVPDFKLLQQREHTEGKLKAELLAQSLPATYIAFDILSLNGRWLVDLPLAERKRLLASVCRESDHLLLSQYVVGAGRRFFREAVARGFEGVVAKRLSSTYQQGRRSADWLKIKGIRTMDAVICGYTLGKGVRAGTFGSLVLGAFDSDGRLVHIGEVGTGFGEAELAEYRKVLDRLKIATSPFAIPTRIARPVVWVRPRLVCEVAYLSFDKALRAPSFKRMRPDKEPRECTLP